MARVIAINLLLIFLPLIIYSAFIILYKQPEDKAEFWALIPTKTLFTIGFLLMGIFYFTQINFHKTIKDGVYHPAKIQDGKVIPGYISPPESKPADSKNIQPENQQDNKSSSAKQPAQAPENQSKSQKKPEADVKKEPEPDEKQI